MVKFRNVAVLLAVICATVASCSKKDVTSITVSPENLLLEIGQTFTLKATVLPANATFPATTWSSDNPDVVSVRDSVVSALAPGSATILVTADGFFATCAVTVKPIPEPEPEP
ncbi:MAG: Ig domain-containing protein, partial [Bacteroidales bacterium]|nr:Ig domain-containing protein [Bacteroidales bacterium]